MLINTGVAFVLFQDERNEHKGDSFRMVRHSERVKTVEDFPMDGSRRGAIGGDAVRYLKTQTDT